MVCDVVKSNIGNLLDNTLQDTLIQCTKFSMEIRELCESCETIKKTSRDFFKMRNARGLIYFILNDQ